MQISYRIQPNCSEWNEEVEDEASYDPAFEALVLKLAREAKERAKEIKDWD